MPPTVVRSVSNHSQSSRNGSQKIDAERSAINKMTTASTSLRKDARASTSSSKSSVRNDARTSNDTGKRNVPIKFKVKSINVSKGSQSSLQALLAAKQIDATKIATKRDSSGKVIQQQSQQQPRNILPTVDKRNNSNRTIQEKSAYVSKASQSTVQSSSAKQIETTKTGMKREKIDQQQPQKVPINVGKKNDSNSQSKIDENREKMVNINDCSVNIATLLLNSVIYFHFQRPQMESINTRPNFVFPSVSKNRQSSKQQVNKSLEKRIPSDEKLTPITIATAPKSVESEASPKTDHKIQKIAAVRIELESFKQKLPDMPPLMLDETSQTNFTKSPAISRTSPTIGNCEKMVNINRLISDRP